MSKQEGEKPVEKKDDSVVTLDRNMLYGGVIVLLVALLTVSVFTRGFGIMPCTADCPQCPACPAQNGSTCEPADPYSGIAKLTVTTGDLPALGQAGAEVLLVTVSDYQCPYCSRFYTNTESLLKSAYVDTGEAKLYFRDFPLSFHEHAMDAAVAARCANEQGKFWEMHDMLFESQESWSSASDVATVFSGYAQSIGADATAFSSCYSARAQEEAITSDMNAAASSGVRGTPGTFIIMPKSKVDVTELKAEVESLQATYGSDGIKLYQDTNNLIVLVAGAYPFEAFQAVLGTVN